MSQVGGCSVGCVCGLRELVGQVGEREGARGLLRRPIAYAPGDNVENEMIRSCPVAFFGFAGGWWKGAIGATAIRMRTHVIARAQSISAWPFFAEGLCLASCMPLGNANTIDNVESV